MICTNLPLMVINSKSCLSRLWQYANRLKYLWGNTVNVYKLQSIKITLCLGGLRNYYGKEGVS